MKTPLMRGFTIIELMVGIAVLGVLLAVAVPSFNEISSANRVTSASNEFLTAINFARSEATKRREPVTICPANTAGSGCTGNTDWSTGWLVFVDSGATVGAIDAGETILQTWSADAGVTIAQTSANQFVRFVSDGSPDGVTSTFAVAASSTGKYPRCVRVETTGRLSLVKSTCV